MRKLILKWLISDEKLWTIAGDIALRFHDKETGEYDDLQDKLYYWIKCGLFK